MRQGTEPDGPRRYPVAEAIGAVAEAVACQTALVGTQHLLRAALQDPGVARVGAPVGISTDRLRELAWSLVGAEHSSSVAVEPGQVRILERAAEVLECAVGRCSPIAESPTEVREPGPNATAELRQAVFATLLGLREPCVATLLLGEIDREALIADLQRVSPT